MKLKLLENAVMVHIKFTRNRVCDDMEEMDIAIEDYDGWDEEGIENWKREVRETIEAHYNQYHYWDVIEISYQFQVCDLKGKLIREVVISW